MNNFITIKYIDALYFTTEKFEYSDLEEHIATGKLIEFSDKHVKIAFTELNDQPESGLILPKETLIFENYNNRTEKNFNFKEGNEIGIYWNDIVFFNGGEIPSQSTKMYTEGKVVRQDDRVIILKNPTTLMLKDKIQNHPKQMSTFVIIPKVMTTDYEIHN